jgi:hypothetical protein
VALDDELTNRITRKIPNALALVGSKAGDERNAMTTSWITQLSMEPVLIGIGVDNTAVTHRLVTEGGSFTINLWDADDTRVFVKFSKPAVDDGDTLNGRAVHAGTTGAPVFDEAIAWVQHRVQQTADLVGVGGQGDARERCPGASARVPARPDPREEGAQPVKVGRAATGPAIGAGGAGGAGGGGGWSSTAPMSHPLVPSSLPSAGRGKPR